jgi:hypothetical protein
MAANEQARGVRRHLDSCSKCQAEFRLFTLGQSALEFAGSERTITPDELFFRSVRARIARGADGAGVDWREDGWAAALLATARQLIPAMALLLLLILGATLLWNNSHSREVARQQQVGYELPEPSPDEVVDSMVAVEDRRNGR